MFTRARPCPRAHQSTGIWLASASPGRPLLCPKRKLMQYRSPIVKRSRLSSPILASATLKARTHSRRPQIPRPVYVIIFINSIQSQDLSQRSLGARLAPLPLTGGCGSAPGGHAAPAPLPRPEEGRDLGADRDRRLASTPKKPSPGVNDRGSCLPAAAPPGRPSPTPARAPSPLQTPPRALPR